VTQSLYETIGGLSLPVDLTPVRADRTLTSLDPGRRILADLFKAAIEAELGDAWRLAAYRLPDDGDISRQTPVADVLELPVTPAVMQERQSKFPLLAVSRSGRGVDEQYSLEVTQLRQPWTVEWILGPADVATAFQLLDTATAIWKIVRGVVRRKGHPAYEDGAIQFGEESSPFSMVRVTGHEGPGQSQFVSGDKAAATYWSVTISLETLELSDHIDLSEGAPLEGVNATFGIDQSGDPAVRVRS
jgi:hypothetical protein